MAGRGSGGEGSGLTRRELLKKGSMAGIGMAWVAPAVTSIEMTPELAQATSGPPETSPTTQPSQPTSSTSSDTSTTRPETSSTVESTSTSVAEQTTTTAGEEQPTSTVGQTSTTAGQTSSTTAGRTSTTTGQTSTTTGQTSTSPTVESQTTSQTTPQNQKPNAEVEDEVLAGELPFTGLHFEQLLPLAGGAIATGAAIVRAARDKRDAETEEPLDG